MTAAVLDRPSSFTGPDPAGHGGTLEDLLNSALREVHAHARTECPVCHGAMISAGAAARCAGCGSRLT